MPSKTGIINEGFILFVGWITAVLAVLICLFAIEYPVFGSFSWNYEPEFDPLLSQNSTVQEKEQARIHARDTAHMRIISYVVISIVAASFFMALFIWREKVKEMAAKELLEAKWESARNEIRTISQNFALVTELLVYGLAQLTPMESNKTSEFLQKFRSKDPQCSIILHQLLSSKGQSALSEMDLENRSKFAVQKIREILAEYDSVLEGSSLDSEAYYSTCEEIL